MLLGTIRDSLFGNMLAAKGIVRAGYDNKKVKQGQGIVRAGYGSKMDFQCCHILSLTLRYKSIIRMNPNLMVFIHVIICPIK